MTRISIGVLPSELPDQMLVNEATRELPRLYNMKPCKYVPEAPTLGRGHVGFWRAHMPQVKVWHANLVDECHHRGKALHYQPITNGLIFDATLIDYMHAMRLAMMERICERVLSMKREPTYTNREPPKWLNDTLKQREHSEALQ